MKKTLLFIISLIIVFSATSQINIDQTDMPVSGEILKSRVASSLTGLNYTQTGSNFTWNFATLQSTTEVADTFVTVLSTGITYYPSFSNPFDPEHFASFAIKQSMGNIPMIPISDGIAFYKVQSSSYTQVGAGAKISSVGVPLKLNPTDRIYKFPMVMGSVDTSISEMHAGLTGFGYFGEKRNRITTVDGWGTLYLPNDTFSVMRVKSVIQYEDSLYLDTLGFGFNLPRTETEYKWLAKGIHQPVLQVTVRNSLPSARYYSSLPINAGIEESALNPGFSVFPNPAKNNAYIRFTDAFSGPYKIYIIDYTGRLVMHETRQNTEQTLISVDALKAGLYIIQIDNGNYRYSQKLLIY